MEFVQGTWNLHGDTGTHGRFSPRNGMARDAWSLREALTLDMKDSMEGDKRCYTDFLLTRKSHDYFDQP